MFSLVSGFLQTYVFAKTEINIIILGLDGAGKTVSSGMSGVFFAGSSLQLALSLLLFLPAADSTGAYEEYF